MGTTYMLNMTPIDVMSSGVKGQKTGFLGFWLITQKLINRIAPNFVGMRSLPLYSTVINFEEIETIGAEVSCMI